MAKRASRFDPYKSFNFQVVAAAVVAGAAAFVISRKLTGRRSGPEATRRNAFWRMFGLD